MMHNERGIEELLAEILLKFDNQVAEQWETNSQPQESNKRLARLEDHQIKTNLAIGELRLSVMRLADEIKVVHDLEHRVSAIEVQLRSSS